MTEVHQHFLEALKFGGFDLLTKRLCEQPDLGQLDQIKDKGDRGRQFSYFLWTDK